jgi:hypothetical protein
LGGSEGEIDVDPGTVERTQSIPVGWQAREEGMLKDQLQDVVDGAL